MSNENNQQIRGYVVSSELLRDLISYLESRPYREVSPLMQGLIAQIEAQNSAAQQGKDNEEASK